MDRPKRLLLNHGTRMRAVMMASSLATSVGIRAPARPVDPVAERRREQLARDRSELEEKRLREKRYKRHRRV